MKHPSHLLDSLFTNTHSLPPPNPLHFPPSQNWPASCQAKTVCLPSVSLHQSLLTSPTFYQSIPPYSSQLCNPSTQSCTPPTPLHSVWTHLAWGNKQRRVCVRGGRDGVSLREGTMLLLVALNLRLLLWVSVCVSLINYLDFTFTEALNTSPRYSIRALLHQLTRQYRQKQSDIFSIQLQKSSCSQYLVTFQGVNPTINKSCLHSRFCGW